MKKMICFFLAVVFIIAALAACQKIKPDETTSTTPSIDVITDSQTTATTSATTQSSEVTTVPSSGSSETAATSIPAETTAATAGTEQTATEQTTPSIVTTEETTAQTTATSYDGIVPSESEPPTRIKGVMCASVSDLIKFLSSDEESDLVRYFGENYVSEHKSEYFDVLKKIAEFDSVFFPAFDGDMNVLRDRDYPIYVTIESDGRYEIIFNIEHEGNVGNFSLTNHKLSTDPKTVNSVSTYVLGNKQTVYWQENTSSSGLLSSYAFFEYGDAWLVINLDHCHYEKVFEYLGKLDVVAVDIAKYASDKKFLKQLEEMCVLPTDIGSSDSESYKEVWFAGEISDVENNRTRTFGLKNGDIYCGFDKDAFGGKKIAVNVYAFNKVGANIVEVDAATLGNHFKSKGVETYFWNETVTIILDEEQFADIEEIAKVPDHETYRIGLFLAALPLEKPVVFGEAEGGVNEYEVVKYDFGEYSLARSILLERGEEPSEENVRELTLIAQEFYWEKLLKFYGLKSETLNGYTEISPVPPVLSASWLLDSEQIETVRKTIGYIVQIRYYEEI